MVLRCHALGDECKNWQHGQSRHYCDDCGDGVHGMSPCSLRIRNTERYRCMNCVRDREEMAEKKEKEKKQQILASPNHEIEIVKMIRSEVSNIYHQKCS